MFEVLKEFIEKRGAINASFHRVENAYRTGKITQEEYEELMKMIEEKRI